MNFSAAKPAARTLLLSATVLLAGCTLVKKHSLNAAGDWAFTGKMAIRSANEASSFNVQWLQQQAYYQISLSGPLGQGEMTIKGVPGDVTLHSGKDTYRANNLNQLVYELTQMHLPLDHLPYWVRSQAMPASAASETRNQAGQLTKLIQSGWTVTYSAYFADSELPRKLTFQRGSDSGKLVIRHWQTKTD